MRKYPVIITLVLTLFLSSVGTSYAAFSDIQGSWAREAITRLDELGAFQGIMDTNNYEPNTTISREDVIQISGRVFELSDSEKQLLYTWLDHFLPMDENANYSGDVLTRAELAALTTNLLSLDTKAITGDLFPSFSDVEKDHPAFVHIELVNQLGILPTYVMDRFEPDRLATRAEVAAILDAARQLTTIEGTVTETYPTSNRIIVQDLNGEFQSLPIEHNTLIFSNNQKTTIDQVRIGEKIHAVHDKHGAIRFIALHRDGQQTAQSLIQGLGSLLGSLNGTISQDQLASILSGNWGVLSENLRYDLYQQLIDLGLAPWEAEAVLAQDWDSLGNLAKDRVAYEATDYLGISPELAFAALNQDWDRLMEYAQVELIQRLMQGWNL